MNGKPFFGCSKFPGCRGTRHIDFAMQDDAYQDLEDFPDLGFDH